MQCDMITTLSLVKVTYMVALMVKNTPASAGDVRDVGSIPRLGRSPGEGCGNPIFLPGESPWIEAPGRPQSTGSQRVGHNWSDLACTHTTIRSYKTFLLWWEHLRSTAMKVKVAQFCPTPRYTTDGILQARILEWVAVPFSRASSQPRDRTPVSHIAGGFFTSWATREVHTWLQNFSLMMRAFKVYCHSNFQIYSTVLLTNINILVTMLTALNLILIRYISIS